MDLKDMIYRRKSIRSYTNEPLNNEMIDEIHNFVESVDPLYPDIKVKMEIVERSQVKCICPWTTPQIIIIFSEEKPGYLENVGFIFQQLELYLQSKGIGTCWLGMGKLTAEDVFAEAKENGLEYVMMIAFGHPKGNAMRDGKDAFKRKALADIADFPDEKLEPARFAPSSINSQPWYFVHEGQWIHTYCSHKGVISKRLGNTNQIDIGIALAHMFVANQETFKFEKLVEVEEKKGYTYIGSFSV